MQTRFLYGNHDFESRHFPKYKFAALEGKVYIEHGFRGDKWEAFSNPDAPLWEIGQLGFLAIRELNAKIATLAVDANIIEPDENFAFGVQSGENPIYDYPSGYLSLVYSPLLEPHSTAGLCTHAGDPKVAYFSWIEEMRAMGRLPNYLMPWKIGVGILILVAISGFLVYAYVMEGIQFRKELDKDKEEVPKEISFEEESKKKPKRRKKKKPKTIEFTYDLNNE